MYIPESTWTALFTNIVTAWIMASSIRKCISSDIWSYQQRSKQETGPSFTRYDYVVSVFITWYVCKITSWDEILTKTQHFTQITSIFTLLRNPALTFCYNKASAGEGLESPYRRLAVKIKVNKCWRWARKYCVDGIFRTI